MSELTYIILRLVFLGALACFVLAIVYALRSDLFGSPARRMRKQDTQQQSQQRKTEAPVFQQTASATLPSAGSSGPARKLIITSGVAEGTEIPLESPVLTIGRSPDSTLVILDEYTSTHHARLALRGQEWELTDLDSTNGTRVAGVALNGMVKLQVFTPVTIGTTTFELRP